MFLCLLYAPIHQKTFQVGVNLLDNKSNSDSESSDSGSIYVQWNWGPAGRLIEKSKLSVGFFTATPRSFGVHLNLVQHHGEVKNDMPL